MASRLTGLWMLVGGLGLLQSASMSTAHEPAASAPGRQAWLRQGSDVFKERCVVCHGVHGDGQSKLARLLSPPPANLRISKLTLEQRTEIVTKGGQAVGRSPSMPAWGEELKPQELQAVIAFVGTLHASPPPQQAPWPTP